MWEHKNMNLNSLSRYLSVISSSVNKDPRFDYSLLDTLQHFAWRKYASAYQISSTIKNTAWKMAYKNVNKRVNALSSAGLIQETEIDDKQSNKHKAKYYQLTEYGIYRLFLDRVEFMLVNQSDVWHRGLSESYTSMNTLTFFRNYGNSRLFEVFLYPYFTKESLIAIGDSLFLIKLYRYLASCCKEVEEHLNSKRLGSTFFNPIFSWNNIPGTDDQKLLAHLKEKFNLENIQQAGIKKEDIEQGSKIVVNIPGEAPVIITLDKTTNRVEIISREANQSLYKKLEYDVYVLDGKTVVGNKMDTDDDSTKYIIENTRRMMEELIYGFVYDLALLSPVEKPEVSYYIQILSKDDRFMNTLREIYENRHKVFERGYSMLTTTR
jgi:DNA-binding PadR family transcriptional regulator